MQLGHTAAKDAAAAGTMKNHYAGVKACRSGGSGAVLVGVVSREVRSRRVVSGEVRSRGWPGHSVGDRLDEV